MRVLIIDDESNKRRQWEKGIIDLAIPGMTLSAPGNDDIATLLTTLYNRRDANDRNEKIPDVACAFDDADVLVVDFDLRDLRDHQGFATAEEIAYSARLYSRVKIVVVVNHPVIGLDNYDLTLQRDREFKGDVYVGYRQVANPSLWIADRMHAGFSPWAWVPLTEDAATFEARVGEVRRSLDVGVLEFLDLRGLAQNLSAEMLSFLGLKKGEDVPLRQILARPSSTYLRARDKDSLLLDEDRLSYVLTSLLTKWIRKWIVLPQTLLVDAPHLAAFLPWSLEDYTKFESWRRLEARGGSGGLDSLNGLFKGEVFASAHTKQAWTGRPAFKISDIREQLEAAGVPGADFRSRDVPQVVFAEDVSRFIPSEDALEYTIILDGEPQIRAVCQSDRLEVVDARYGLDGIIYSPESLVL
jgi:hypothetical protein